MGNRGSAVSTRKDSARHWREMPFKLGATAAEKAAIGLITLANDLSIEPEIIRFLPRDGVALYSNRIPFPDAATPQTLAAMERDISRVTALINPGEKLDVVIFGCTSGTMTIGDAVVRDRILEARPDVLTTDPITAGLAGLRELGCRRIALLTPYTDEVNRIVEAFVSSKGMDVGARGSFKRGSSAEVCRISPESFLEAGLALGREAVDGLFISCTAVRVSSIMEQLEVELGKPVVSSNQALAWHSMRLAGCNESVPGYGRLLRS